MIKTRRYVLVLMKVDEGPIVKELTSFAPAEGEAEI